jgi:hypothetical protein
MKNLFNFFCKHEKRTILFQYFIRTKNVGEGPIYKAFRTYECNNCKKILTKKVLEVKCGWLDYDTDDYYKDSLTNNGFSKYEDLVMDQNFDNYIIK